MKIIECRPGTGMTMYAVYAAYRAWLQSGKPVISSTNLDIAFDYEVFDFLEEVENIMEKGEENGLK